MRIVLKNSTLQQHIVVFSGGAMCLCVGVSWRGFPPSWLFQPGILGCPSAEGRSEEWV